MTTFLMWLGAPPSPPLWYSCSTPLMMTFPHSPRPPPSTYPHTFTNQKKTHMAAAARSDAALAAGSGSGERRCAPNHAPRAPQSSSAAQTRGGTHATAAASSAASSVELLRRYEASWAALSERNADICRRGLDFAADVKAAHIRATARAAEHRQLHEGLETLPPLLLEVAQGIASACARCDALEARLHDACVAHAEAGEARWRRHRQLTAESAEAGRLELARRAQVDLARRQSAEGRLRHSIARPPNTRSVPSASRSSKPSLSRSVPPISRRSDSDLRWWQETKRSISAPSRRRLVLSARDPPAIADLRLSDVRPQPNVVANQSELDAFYDDDED